MSDNVMLDTNLWVYLYAQNDPKSKHVRPLVEEHFTSITVSTQIIGELYNVLTRKLHTPASQARETATQMLNSFIVVPIAISNTIKALEITERYGYSYWDSLVIATALLNDCDILYSEDMQHYQQIEELRIVNPFI